MNSVFFTYYLLPRDWVRVQKDIQTPINTRISCCIKIIFAACGGLAACEVVCLRKQNKTNPLWIGFNKKKHLPKQVPFLGDPYGNRTHVTAVKGPCLNRLTNGPFIESIGAYTLYHVVAAPGFEPGTLRV